MNNVVDLENYKKHPRILEVRFILLYDMFEREYGAVRASKYFEAICDMFHINFVFINAIIHRRFEISKYSKTKRLRWKQEVIFAAKCYDETIYKVAKDYLVVARSNLYVYPELKLENFVTDEWLRELDEEAKVCGTEAYRMSIEHLFEVIDDLANVLVRWGAKQ